MKVGTCDITWANGAPKIETARFTLRPIKEEDREAYQKLFLDKIAMSGYRGGPRDISKRFDGWLQRWNWHPFSALAIEDKSNGEVIGHAVVGHGDYEGWHDRGFSEAAVVVKPEYWGAKSGSGSTGKGVGREIFSSLGVYAKHLAKHGYLVPSDVGEHRQEEAEILSLYGMKVHRDQSGKIQWIYLPFTELRATSSPENSASYLLLSQAAQENKGTVEPAGQGRDLFRFSL